MALKVRVFDEEHEQDLENEINLFLSEIDPVCFVDIKYSLHAFLSMTGEQIYFYSALIVYREDDVKKHVLKKNQKK